MSIELQGTGVGDIQQLAVTPTLLYANPAGKKSAIKGFSIHNTYASNVTVKLYRVPNSAGVLGTPGTANRICNLSIPANETIPWSDNFPRYLANTNDAIFGEASVAGAVNIEPLGDTYTIS